MSNAVLTVEDLLIHIGMDGRRIKDDDAALTPLLRQALEQGLVRWRGGFLQVWLDSTHWSLTERGMEALKALTGASAPPVVETPAVQESEMAGGDQRAQAPAEEQAAGAAATSEPVVADVPPSVADGDRSTPPAAVVDPETEPPPAAVSPDERTAIIREVNEVLLNGTGDRRSIVETEEQRAVAAAELHRFVKKLLATIGNMQVLREEIAKVAQVGQFYRLRGAQRKVLDFSRRNIARWASNMGAFALRGIDDQTP